MLVAMVQLLTVQLTVTLMVFQILLLLQYMLLSVSILVLLCTVPMIHALISITLTKLFQSVTIPVSVYNVIHRYKNVVKTEYGTLCSGVSMESIYIYLCNKENWVILTVVVFSIDSSMLVTSFYY